MKMPTQGRSWGPLSAVFLCVVVVVVVVVLFCFE